MKTLLEFLVNDNKVKQEPITEFLVNDTTVKQEPITEFLVNDNKVKQEPITEFLVNDNKVKQEPITEFLVNKPITTATKKDNHEEWGEKCKDFCTAGNWRWTNNLTSKDFEQFIEDAKSFNVKSWNISNNKEKEKLIKGYNLAMALLNKDPKTALDIYETESDSTVWWYQRLCHRDPQYKNLNIFIIEALMTISFSLYLNNTIGWVGGEYQPSDFIKKMKEHIK